MICFSLKHALRVSILITSVVTRGTLLRHCLGNPPHPQSWMPTPGRGQGEGGWITAGISDPATFEGLLKCQHIPLSPQADACAFCSFLCFVFVDTVVVPTLDNSAQVWVPSMPEFLELLGCSGTQMLVLLGQETPGSHLWWRW